jgi:glycosyltransferase involved in cell wall biosynthesis
MIPDATVVIRCKDDERVFDCIASIDESVEIIVVMNPNEDMEKRLRDIGVICKHSPPGNLSIVSNIGFESASADKIIITDSDTIFGEKSISALIDGLNDYAVVRSPLRFERKDDFLSRELAEARDYVNSLPVVYTPGIAVSRTLPERIKGFLFDDAIPFAVDANLNFRIQQENVPVLYLENVWISHSAELVTHDLKAARRIGSGCRESSKRLVTLYPDIPETEIGYALKGVKRSHYYDLFKKKGFRVFLYQLLWDIAFYRGYYLD